MAQGEPALSDSLLDPSLSRNVSFRRLNAQAPEFVPNRSATTAPPPAPQVHVYSPPPTPFHVPIQVVPPPPPPHVVPVHHRHHLPVQYHHHQYYAAGFGVGGDQEMTGQGQQPQPQPDEQAQADHATSSSSKTHKLSDEATSKILNQVEYYFSDLNLATTDHLMRFINKDPEGFVPISVVASFKKIKALVNSHSQLATVLRNSSKLVVHEDGKKVRRQHPLTQSDMEELQSSIVVAENLPEDHCHQNLMKIFSSAGSVKTIRTCQPQTSNSNSSSASRSAKADGMHFSNKLHAFVEYESPELAEKAVAELNDEGNWRSGLRVRLMHKRMQIDIMERQSSFRTAKIEKQVSFNGAIEKQSSFRGAMEKQKSFRGLMEKQKSFRIVMEKQLSFIGGGSSERRKSKESPGKRGDSQLHLAARAGNLDRVKEIVGNCNTSTSTSSNEAIGLLMSKTNQEGETPLYASAENDHAVVVREMLKHMDLQSASIAARNGYDPFHIAVRQGHLEVLKELLHVFPNLAMTTDLSNSTALHTAATQGHIEIVNLLLETDSNLAKIARNNGKTVLHSAARMGHLEVVKSLLSKDPSAAFRTDLKGQTALHMAVKGQNEEIVLELIKPDPSVLASEDNKGNTALHIATRKGRIENVRCLLSIEGININAINKGGETPFDITEKFGSSELVSVLKEAGATNSGKPSNPAKQLKQTVSDIKHDVQSQLQQTRQTGARVQKIAKKLKKLHISGLNNAINSATVVAVLIATVAFAAIFTVPGQYVEVDTPGFTLGQAHIARNAAFIIFFVFDSLALFISLAVVVVQTSVVVIEQKAKKQLVFVINKLMWLACLFISIAFISLTYVVVGSQSRWLAVYATVIGSTIMLTTIGSMCYCVVLHRMEESKLRNIRKAESRSRSFSMSMASDHEILNSEYKRMYAL